MKLPKIPKDQLPDDLKDQIEGDEAEFEPLGETEDAMKHVRQKKSESEMRRTLGELEKLNKGSKIDILHYVDEIGKTKGIEERDRLLKLIEDRE